MEIELHRLRQRLLALSQAIQDKAHSVDGVSIVMKITTVEGNDVGKRTAGVFFDTSVMVQI